MGYNLNYNLELEKAVEKIKEKKAKLVCIQLPDGLKPEAKEIVETLEKETSARVLIWLGSSYGVCDLPLGLERLGVELLFSWGHNRRLAVWK